jgi:hypothetical protein
MVNLYLVDQSGLSLWRIQGCAPRAQRKKAPGHAQRLFFEFAKAI